MTRGQLIELRRTIKRTLSRFVAIFLIVALGVAFYAGIRATKPDMLLSADKYYDESRFYDIWVLGDLGVTGDDIKAIESIDGVEEVEGSYSCDIFGTMEGEENKQVLKALSVMDNINIVKVSEGRLPESGGECLIDEHIVTKNGVGIGDTITLSSGIEDDDDIKDIVKTCEVKIVGIGTSSYYIDLERGKSSIGSGNVYGFIYLPKSDFLLEAYTDIYVRVEGANNLNSFTKKYENKVENIEDRIEELSDVRCSIRYDEVQEEGNERIAQGEQDIKEGEQKIADARQELEDARIKLEDAKLKLEDGEKELEDGERKVADAKQKYNDGVVELADAKLKLEDALKELEDGERDLVSGKNDLVSGWSDYNDGIAKYASGEDELYIASTKLKEAQGKVDSGKIIINYYNKMNAILAQANAKQAELVADPTNATLQAEMVALTQSTIIAYIDYIKATGIDKSIVTNILNMSGVMAGINTDYNAYYPIGNKIGDWDNSLDGTGELTRIMTAVVTNADNTTSVSTMFYTVASVMSQAMSQQMDNQSTSIALAQADIDKGNIKTEIGRRDLANAKEELEYALTTLKEGEDQLVWARQKLDDGWQEYHDGLIDYEEGVKELEDGRLKLEDAQVTLEEARIKLEEGKQEYEDGLAEYNDAKTDADDKLIEAESDIEEAKKEIVEGKKDLLDIEIPKWYILTRNHNQSFISYKIDADRIGAIGTVFPAIFYLVAALVSLTTMTRMVEEERTQIGTMKALGYGNMAITSKFLLYALVATVCGCVVGLLFGQIVLPKVIIGAYRLMYVNLTYVVTPISPVYSIISSLAGIASTLIATVWACLRELRESPANLMRPVPPKKGKRVLLERIGIIWNNISFTSKATIRNLIRYKKRFFMTIFGIGGCMALLIVGFGLKDALNVIVSEQYVNIINYESIITLDEDLSEREINGIIENLAEDSRIDKSMVTYHYAYEVVKDSDDRKNSILGDRNDGHSEVEISNDVYLIVPKQPDRIDEFVSLRHRIDHKSINLSDEGAVITEKLATKLKLSIGDSITVKDGDAKYSLIISDITENYYFHYLYITPNYYKKVFGEEAPYNSIYTQNVSNDVITERELGEDILKLDGTSQILFYTFNQKAAKDMLKSMETIIWVLVISAGLLAFIVLYNLNNININERMRELSTLKVLGFFDIEVSSYVLRENILLTGIGIVLGIFLGKLLTAYIIRTAEIDLMMFGRVIEPRSYIICVGLTIMFSLIVNASMHFALKKIDMIDALKSVE